MAKITLRLPTDQDIIELADTLRQSDRDELAVVCTYSAREAVLKSVLASDPDFLFAVLADGKLLGIFGASSPSLLSRVGVPWLLATDEMNKYTKRLTQDTQRVVRMMLEKWPVLTNVIDVRNTMTMRWLKVIGFEFKETYVVKDNLPVIRFEMRRTDE